MTDHCRWRFPTGIGPIHVRLDNRPQGARANLGQHRPDDRLCFPRTSLPFQQAANGLAYFPGGGFRNLVPKRFFLSPSGTLRASRVSRSTISAYSSVSLRYRP